MNVFRNDNLRPVNIEERAKFQAELEDLAGRYGWQLKEEGACCFWPVLDQNGDRTPDVMAWFIPKSQ